MLALPQMYIVHGGKYPGSVEAELVGTACHTTVYLLNDTLRWALPARRGRLVVPGGGPLA